MDDKSWQNRVEDDYFDVRGYAKVLLSCMSEFKDKENLNSFHIFKVCWNFEGKHLAPNYTKH